MSLQFTVPNMPCSACSETITNAIKTINEAILNGLVGNGNTEMRFSSSGRSLQDQAAIVRAEFDKATKHLTYSGHSGVWSDLQFVVLSNQMRLLQQII